MPHFLSCLHRPSKNEVETLELSLLPVWGFVLFLHVLMPFSSSCLQNWGVFTLRVFERILGLSQIGMKAA